MPRIRMKTPMPLHKLSDTTPRNDTTRYELVPLTSRMADTTPELEGKQFFYGRSGAMMTNDRGVAEAIQQKYGKKEMLMFETKAAFHPADKGHKYTFGGVRLPWHKYCELCGRRMSNDTDGTTCGLCRERMAADANSDQTGEANC